MKKLLFLFLLLPLYSFGQICADEDTVRSNAVTLITATTARVNGTTTHFSGSVVSMQLRYVRTGQTDTATASAVGTSALRNITGLQAGTQYTYYYKSICGSGTVSQAIGPYTFTTLTSTVVYAAERSTVFPYVKVDTGFTIPRLDTGSLYRAADIGGNIRFRPADSLPYYYNGDIWKLLAVDSAGILPALNRKVDSVTVSGDSLFYWINGVSYGYILPGTTTEWSLLGNAGTTAGTNFIGTTDAVGLSVKTNSVERLRVPPAGIASSTDATDSVLVTKTDGYTLGKIAKTALHPTWQQTLTAGSTLTTDNTINGGNYELTFTNISNFEIYTNAAFNVAAAAGGVSLSGENSRIGIADTIGLQPYSGQLYIDTLTSAVGTKSLRYNPTSGLVSYADTTTSGSPSLTATYIGYGDGSNLLTGTSGLTYDVAATTGSGLSLASSAITSGALATFTNTGTAAASNTKRVAEFITSGANTNASQTVTAVKISNTNTGTTSTNVGLNVITSGATNNYGLIVGNVTPPSVGVTWTGYFHGAGTYNRVGIAGNLPAIEFINSAGTRTWQFSEGSGNFDFYNNQGSGTTLSLNGTTGAATFSKQIIASTNGAASTPPITATGTWFTGGTATTTKPQLLIEPTGATSTAWSTSGTGLGVNAATGFTGNLIDAQLNGGARFFVTSAGLGNFKSNISVGGGANQTTIRSDAILLGGASSSSFIIYGDQGAFTPTLTFNPSAFPTYPNTIIVNSGKFGVNVSPTTDLQTTSFATAYVAKTSDYTATISNYTIHFTSGTSTFTLPTAVGITGRIYVVRNDSGNTLTLATTSSQTIDGSAPGTQATGTVKQYQSTGANWISLN